MELTALPFTAAGKAQVTVLANDVNPMTKVAIDVALDGSAAFAGPGDMNQTADNITLTNNKPVTITLNALPSPYLSSYLVRARVIDSLGNQGISNMATMQGPQPDVVKLTVPATATASAGTASIQVTSGTGNGYASTVYVDTSLNGAAYTSYGAATLSVRGRRR